ncbi:MAG: hypothetical protein J6V44_07940 [Methanobrevibacter sp.]|nr:hypothetical protein [Methanobrevibacter sp.]
MFAARSKYLEARSNNSGDIKTSEDEYFNASKAVKNLEEKLKEAKEGLLSYKKALEEEYKK